MDRQIRRLGVGLIVCFVVAVRAAQPTSRCSGPTSSTTNPATPAQIRRDFSRPRGHDRRRPTASCSPASVPTRRPVRVPARVPREGRCSATSPASSTSASAPRASSRSYNDELAGRTAEQQIQDARRPVRRQGPRRRRRRSRSATDVQQVATRRSSATGRARSSRSTRAPARSSRCGRYPTLRPEPARRPRHRRRPPARQRAARRRPRQAAAWPRRYRERFFPGSTFKVVTGSAGLETGKVTTDTPVVPGRHGVHAAGHDPPDPELRRRGLRRHAVRRSSPCRATSSFAQMGVDIGADAMVDGRRGLRLQPGAADRPARPPARVELPRPTSRTTARRLAQASIGQNDVRRHARCRWRWSPPASPTAASIMAPHVMHGDPRRRRRRWSTTLRARGRGRRRSTPAAAGTMREAMIGVVAERHAPRALADPRRRRSAARPAPPSSAPTRPGRTRGSSASPARPASPQVAVAVIVEGQPGASEADRRAGRRARSARPSCSRR